MRVIVTRPAAQARTWVPQLQALGLDAVSLPLIGIEPAPDREALQSAWRQLAGTALVMFVSANAVAHFFAARPADSAWPGDTLAGSTGPGTSASLRAAGVAVDRIAEPDAAGPFDTEALWRRIGRGPWNGRRVLVVRGEQGRDWLADQLREAGAVVSFVAAYRRVAPRLDGTAATVLDEALADPASHCWHFTSSEAVAHLVQARPQATWTQARALATHTRIADTARHAGFGHVQSVGVHPQDVATLLQAADAAPW